MITGQKGVKYGLSIPVPKKAAPPRAKPSIFGDDESDDEHDNVERQISRHQARKQEDKKVSCWCA